MSRATYHHGDLRRALIASATELVRDHGAAQLRLREAARRVGVSPSAGYHHFPDREALVRAVAGVALDELTVVIRQALRPLHATPARPRLIALAGAYVGWALDEPRLFRLALGPERDYPGTPVNIEPLATLTGEIDGLVSEGAIDPRQRRWAQVAVWSTTHGLATLVADGPLQPAGGRRGAVRLARQVVTMTLDGVAVSSAR